jgi:CubicO group peptidase (beta-lactamase class C family)/cytochrome oxidase Cu insertion factor (SCO1/SenC/PrrC family)
MAIELRIVGKECVQLFRLNKTPVTNVPQTGDPPASYGSTHELEELVSCLKNLEPKTISLAAWNFFFGFVAFVIVKETSHFTRQHQDIRPFVLSACLAFFCAGFYCARSIPKGRVRAAFLLALGGFLPAIAINRLGMAWTAPPFLFFYLLASSFGIAMGFGVRSLATRRKMAYAVALGLISAVATFFIVFKAIPEWMDRRAYQTLDQEIVPFSVQTLAGTTLHSRDWKGQVVLLSFWATWCLPCHAELPEIEEVQNRYRENPNVVFLALDSGTGGDTPDGARAYLNASKLSLTAAIDSVDGNGDSWGHAATSLGVKSLPALYILDRSGRLRMIHLGYDASEHLTERLSREIDRLLMPTVDSFIRAEMAKHHIPAIAVSVVKDGRIVFEEGYGPADPESGIKATPNTPFYTASVTKAFTGTALMMLEAQHKIDLDKPINDYLHSAKLRSPMWGVSASTVRRVANHTGGLTTYNRKCTVDDSDCQASTETAISRHGIVVWQPGDHFDYSNPGYGVLGTVISDVSKMPFGQFLEQDLFLPLGMKNCYLQTGPRLRMGSALNHDSNTTKPTPVQISDTPGASSARCSSHDLALFGSFAMKSPLPGQKRVLSDTQLHELLYPDAASAGKKYSFGWDRNLIDGYQGVFAQGGTYDSFALLQLLPEQDIAIAVLSNTGTTLPFEIANRVVAQLLTAKKPEAPAAEQEEQSASSGALLSGQWSGVVSTWHGDVPLNLTIASSHQVSVTVGENDGACEKAKVSLSRLDCIARGDLKTGELPPGASGIELELYLRDGMLVGAATTEGSVQPPYWVILKRKGAPR